MLSACRKYRYRLTRAFGSLLEGQKRILWVMLNPSTADHETDDATIRRCIGFSKKLGGSSLVVVNLFGYRATDPDELLKVEDPVGPENVRVILDAANGCDTVIAAWGALPNKLWAKARTSIEIVKSFDVLRCLGKTKAGAPRHPLYLPAKQELEPWP